MARMKRLIKGNTPPGFGGVSIKVKDKSIDKNQMGYMALKGVGAAHGTFRQ